MRKFYPSYDLLTLENFQSIKNRTEIPIRPLTFLYGPNSAGKSSILDAFSFLETLLKSDEVTLRKMINRWMHRPKGDDTAEPTQAATISLRFVFSDKYDIFQNGWEYWLPDRRELPTEFQNSDLYMGKKPKNKNGDLSPENKIKIDIKISSQYLDLFSMTVSSNETKIIRIYPAEEEDFGCRDDNVALEIFSTPIGEKLKDLAKRHGKFEGSNISYKSPCKIGFAPLRLRSHIDESSAFEQDLLSIANHVLDCLRFYTYALPNVNSDRGTIYNSQLVSFQSFSKRQRPHTPRLTKSPSLACEALSDLTSGIIAHLSEAKFAENKYAWEQEFVARKLTELERALSAEAAAVQNAGAGSEPLHAFVNRCLSEHLFLDQGYQVTYDVCRVLPSDLSGSTSDQVFAALIVCALIDNAGRSLTFEDVGTGISCVLPVLTALYAQESFIQQPELHLHPALQSALADILVERAKSWDGSARHIIETHSEYLLLRCLRRIRETTLGKQLPNSPLSLSKDDVSVLYFDPQPDGTTTVKQLRVSTQGDFIDRWPRGFFEERAKDIFDE